VFAEDNLAERIAAEREAHGWTNDGLAKRMTDAGCPMTGSAIFKIEKAEPRRRIVVDELVAFSRVFGIPIEQLLLDPELVAEQEVIDKLNAVNTLAAARDEAETKLIGTVDEVRALVKGSKRAKAAMNKYLGEIGDTGDFFRVAAPFVNTELFEAHDDEQPETEEA